MNKSLKFHEVIIVEKLTPKELEAVNGGLSEYATGCVIGGGCSSGEGTKKSHETHFTHHI
jgi:hypothetical protein